MILTILRPQIAALALAALALTGCRPEEDPTVLTSTRARLVAPALAPWVDEFTRLYGGALPAIPIAIAPLEKGVAGKCYVPGGKNAADQVGDIVFGGDTGQTRRIVINQSYFQKWKDDYHRMQVVIFHELGHCVLGRGHSLKKWPSPSHGQVPDSIMFPETIGGHPYYPPNVAHYAKELMDGERGAPNASTTKAFAQGKGRDPHPGDDYDDLSGCVEIDPDL